MFQGKPGHGRIRHPVLGTCLNMLDLSTPKSRHTVQEKSFPRIRRTTHTIINKYKYNYKHDYTYKYINITITIKRNINININITINIHINITINK